MPRQVAAVQRMILIRWFVRVTGFFDVPFIDFWDSQVSVARAVDIAPDPVAGCIGIVARIVIVRCI